MGRTKQHTGDSRAKRRAERDAVKKRSPPSDDAAPKRTKSVVAIAGKLPPRATATPAAAAHVVVRPSMQPNKSTKTQQPLHHAARVVAVSGQVVRPPVDVDGANLKSKKKKKKRRRRKASVEEKDQEGGTTAPDTETPINEPDVNKHKPQAAKRPVVVVTPPSRKPPTGRRSLHVQTATDAPPPVVTRTLRSSSVQRQTMIGRPPRVPKQRAARMVPMMSPLPQVSPPRVVRPNEEDDEDANLIQMQKRLFKNTKRRIIPESPTPEKQTNERVATRSSSVMQRAAEARKAIMEQQPDSPPRRRAFTVTLSNWCLSWPLPCNSETLQLELAFEGKVGGKRHLKRFEVERRVNCAQFVSTTHKSVKLEGCLDVEKAEQAGIPPTVIQLMLEGIPAHWRRKMEDCLSVDKRHKTANRKRKRTESSAEKRHTEGRVKSLKNAREVTPVIDWWQGDQPSTSKTSKTKQQKTASTLKQTEKLSDPAGKTIEWTDAQLQSLMSAKLKVKTTVPNFWAEVAALVPGKSADDCRAKSFETFASPSGRKPTKRPAEAHSKGAAAEIQIPTKIHRAGSNLFKKQVREFVEQQEKKHVDDLFAQVTPSKAELGGLAGLDDLSSPAVAGTFMNSDSEDDEREVTPGRERLERVSTSKRDEVDSYVLNLKRSRIGQDMTKSKPPKSSAAALRTPRPKKQATKKSMYLVEECGSHYLEASVSPGGTTHVRIEKDGSSTESEPEYRSSDEEDDLF